MLRFYQVTMDSSDAIYFPDHPEFQPNLTPRQIFEQGAFGGTYFRAIHSQITGKDYDNLQWQEFPFLRDLDPKLLNKSMSEFDVNINKYGVKSGTTLQYWEEKGWIVEQDPYGWVQWYCRFWMGRRSDDDARQIKRWLNFAGPNGRFRKQLQNAVNAAGTTNFDSSIKPVVRQGLHQWAFELR